MYTEFVSVIYCAQIFVGIKNDYWQKMYLHFLSNDLLYWVALFLKKLRAIVLNYKTKNTDKFFVLKCSTIKMFLPCNILNKT